MKDEIKKEVALTQTHNNALKVAVEEVGKMIPSEEGEDDLDEAKRDITRTLNQAIKNIKEKMISPRNPQE